MTKTMVGNGQLNIIVVRKGEFVTILKNRSLHPRTEWWAAKYKGDTYPVFWNASGHECIDISNPEWMGPTSIGSKEMKNYPFFQKMYPERYGNARK